MKILKTDQVRNLIDELVSTTRYEPPVTTRKADGMPPLPDGDDSDESWDFSPMLDFHLGVKDSREGTHNQESHNPNKLSGDIPETESFEVDGMQISRTPPKKGAYGRGIGKVLITPAGDAFWTETRHRALHQHVLGVMLGEKNPKTTSKLDNPDVAFGWAYPDYATLTLHGHGDEPSDTLKKRLKKLYPTVKHIKWSNAKDPNGRLDVRLEVKDLSDQPGKYIDLINYLDFHLAARDKRKGSHNQESHGRRSSTGSSSSDTETAKSYGYDRGPVAERILQDKKNTAELHKRPSGHYTKERKRVHDAIIARYLEGKRPSPGESGRPKATMLAGGWASGKSTAKRLHSPEQAVEIDPDELGESLPEYAPMAEAGERVAGLAVGREGQDIARRLLKEAMKRGLNVVVDGAGNSGKGEFVKSLKGMRDSGFDVSVAYVNVPTEEAWRRSLKRAREQGRFNRYDLLKGAHASVSRNFPDVAKLDFVDKLTLYDNRGFPPTVVAEGRGGGLAVLEQDLYDEFLAKAGEVDMAEPDYIPPGGKIEMIPADSADWLRGDPPTYEDEEDDTPKEWAFNDLSEAQEADNGD